MIETKENIKYQEQESVEFLGEFTKPLFKAGDFLKNKEDGPSAMAAKEVTNRLQKGGATLMFRNFACGFKDN